ncbi:NAC transcription factor 29-like [Lotus japonicus]|uniref:NAC transcription factor 29-like n=1 Tax=Lotus japonicus TaxID=34305 RepID=UPI0025827B55|nr:NAC transcription factor 29-like [Lotus japonicus]
MQHALSSLPPGFQFFPSEEILLNYYLINKNQGQDFDGANLITELELFEYDPFDLPDSTSFAYDHRGRKRHWYYFTERDMHRNKMTMSGFWLRDGRVQIPSSGAGNVVLGTRTSFIFHTGKSIKNVARTNWTLYEYALADHQTV